MSYGIELVFHKAKGSDKPSSIGRKNAVQDEYGLLAFSSILVKGSKCNVLLCQRLSTNERSRATETLGSGSALYVE